MAGPLQKRFIAPAAADQDTKRIDITSGPLAGQSFTARTKLAASYQHAGRTTKAIELLEQAADDTEHILGPDHPDSIAATRVLLGWSQNP
ncbi:tetratricopeptide repeat protein [Streptomyces sp. NPDC057474]|uniref:tetratricopeptide repeat protein n=1 Tax=Streptomyces sp. NPDC057474 TaxID=3346144 RepID=UPI0036D0F3C3